MSLPVATTTAVAAPLPTLVPRKAMLVSSSGDALSLFFSTMNFSTGKLSPVSEPWITNRSLACTTRTSPGIMSPAVICTTSPGTRCEIAISWAVPPRSTVALTEIIAFNLAAALLALASWISRRPTLSTIMSSIIVAARGSPVAKDTAASTASRITSGLRSARPTRVKMPGRWSLARMFWPCSARRASASSLVRPSGRVPRCAYTAGTSSAALSTSARDTRIERFSWLRERSRFGTIPTWSGRTRICRTAYPAALP